MLEHLEAALPAAARGGAAGGTDEDLAQTAPSQALHQQEDLDLAAREFALGVDVGDPVGLGQRWTAGWVRGDCPTGEAWYRASSRGACRPSRARGWTDRSPLPPDPRAAMDGPSLSVVIATRDRAERLEGVLASLEGERGEILEAVVVDNGSRDRTPAVLAAWGAAWPGALALHHGPPGKSGALNAGLRRTRGELLAFLDDDVRVRPGWARALRGAAAQNDAVAFQGRILPPAEALADAAIRARWRRLGTLPHVDLGEGLAERRVLTGANMAVRRPELEALGGFDERLGPGAAGLSEDTDLARRLVARGRRILYVGAAAVEHELDLERLSDAYFDAYHRRLGRSRLLQDRKSLLTSVLPNWALAGVQAGLLGLVWRGDSYYRKRGRRIAYGTMLRELVGRGTRPEEAAP